MLLISSLIPPATAKHAKGFLSQGWCSPSGEQLKGAKHNENLQTVMKIYLDNSPEPMQALENVASKGLASLVDLDKHASAEEFASLNRSVCFCFFFWGGSVRYEERKFLITLFMLGKLKAFSQLHLGCKKFEDKQNW